MQSPGWMKRLVLAWLAPQPSFLNGQGVWVSAGWSDSTVTSDSTSSYQASTGRLTPTRQEDTSQKRHPLQAAKSAEKGTILGRPTDHSETGDQHAISLTAEKRR